MTTDVAKFLGPCWQDKGKFYYLPSDKSKEGMKHLGGKFITAGKLATLLGKMGKNEQDQVIEHMNDSKKKPKVFDTIGAESGLREEARLKIWYHKSIAPIEDAGPAISKDLPSLLTVADSLTLDGKGIVEYKTRKYLNKDLKSGKMPEKDYIQIQGHIHNYDREYCDYIVFSSETGELYYRRIYADLDKDFLKNLLLRCKEILKDKLTSQHILLSLL